MIVSALLIQTPCFKGIKTLTRTEVLTLERVVAGFYFYFFFEKGYVIVIKVEYIEQVTFFFTKKTKI